MQYRSVIAGSLMAGIAFAQDTGALGDATAIHDNPVGVTYQAIFEGDVVTGVVTAGSKTGEGVDFDISLIITPPEGASGAYGYHIHDAPVPESGNCTETLAHLDPFQRGAATPCDAENPETCEVGDLAGKHGKIGDADSTEPALFSAAYNDLYASTKEGLGQFFGNRSIVIHASDKSRIACANFQLVEEPIYHPAEPSSSSSSCSGSAVEEPTAAPIYEPEVPVYEPSAVEPSATDVAPVPTSTPCETFLITKTYASTMPGDYGQQTTISYTSVETSISYSAVPPVMPTAVPEAPVYGTPETPVEGHPETPVYGTPEVPVEGHPETPVYGTPEVPVEGHPETPVYGTPETPVEGHPETPVYGTPEVPVEGHPEVPVEGHPEVPVEAVPEAPVYGTPEAPVEGTPEAPVYGTPETPVEAVPEAPVYGSPETPVEGSPEVPVVPAAPEPVYPTAVAPPAPVAPYPTGAVPSGVPVPPTNGTVPGAPSAYVPAPGASNVPVSPAQPSNSVYTGSAATFGVSSGVALIAAFAGVLALW